MDCDFVRIIERCDTNALGPWMAVAVLSQRPIALTHIAQGANAGGDGAAALILDGV